MLSRLAVRGGSLAPILRVDFRNGLNLTAVRTSSQLENWKKAHELFNSPERDRVNFPDPEMRKTHPPVRMGFIPETWFQFFYDKTGVSGPYILGVGLLTTVISKELWVFEHGMMEFFGFWTAVMSLVYFYGDRVKKALGDAGDKIIDRTWHAPLARAKQNRTLQMEAYEKAIWREEGQKHIFDAKRESVALQLEEEYRRRLFQSYQSVKKRLDYHVAMENTKRRFEQDHMVNWIVDSVVKGITPQQERDSITKCISDLKVLAKAN